MRLGQTFTIEPIFTLGTHAIACWPDGWTLVTKDGSLAAQFEHTLLVTPGGVEVLTEAPAGSSSGGSDSSNKSNSSGSGGGAGRAGSGGGG